MGKHRWTIEIGAPAERVFAYLTDPELGKRWSRGLISYESLTKQENSVGSRSRIFFEANGNQRVVEQEIVRIEPDRLLETRGRCRVTNQGRPLPEFKFRQSYELVDEGNRCALTWTYRMEGFARLWGTVSGFLYGVEREPAQAELERLKREIESE